MKVLAWIAPATWPAVVEAVRRRPEGDDITLATVADRFVALPVGAASGLMGRGRRSSASDAEASTATAAQALLDQAVTALGRPCEAKVLSGATDRVVTAEADDADILILARDGDRSRLGPHSLGKAARFIIDHAPCTVVLLWPGDVPDLGTIPPPPSRG
jgi:nucleotide-binding universal stress UspA family protein